MKKLEGIDEYIYVYSEARKKYRYGFSNITLITSEVERYISEGRMSYCETKEAIWFLLDEGTYNKLFVLGNSPEGFSIPKTEKKTLFRTFYKQDKKDDNLLKYEKWLLQNGMKHICSSSQLIANVDDMLETLSSMEAYEKMLVTNNFKIHKSCENYLNQISELIGKVQFVEDYHLDYFSEEEKIEMCKIGGYICIEAPDGDICGAAITKYAGKIATGLVIAVDEKYAMRGLAPVLSYERNVIAKELGCKKIKACVRNDNTKSVAYHKKLGYTFTDTLADDWVLK